MDPRYRPPSAELVAQGDRADRALYGSGQIGAATFFSGPIAGCWLLAWNLRALGRMSESSKTLVLGAVGTVALLVVGELLHGKPSFALPLLSSLAVRAIADLVQGEDYKRHIAAGGRRQSGWRVLRVALVALAATLATAIPVVMVMGV